MQPSKSYHTAANYRDYRPASQALFSVVYMSLRSVLISVWSTSITLTTHNNAILTKSVLTLTLITITTIDRPRRHWFSVVYTSVNQYYFQCGKEIYRAGRTQSGRIDTYTYPDYRSALQAVVSVIYVDCHYRSV